MKAPALITLSLAASLLFACASRSDLTSEHDQAVSGAEQTDGQAAADNGDVVARGLVGDWTITEIAGVTPLADAEASMTFTADGLANGTAGCNRFNGTYDNAGSSLTFDRVAMTRMACMGERGEQESLFLSVFHDVTTHQIDGDRLTLEAADGRTIVATATPVDANLLVGDWAITEIAGTAPVQGGDASISFLPDGTTHGSTGCNGFSGGYTHSDTDLAFGNVAITEMACMGARGDQEVLFMDVFNNVISIRVDSNGLVLQATDGRTLVAVPFR